LSKHFRNLRHQLYRTEIKVRGTHYDAGFITEKDMTMALDGENSTNSNSELFFPTSHDEGDIWLKKVLTPD
jgi:hypothetical protein